MKKALSILLCMALMVSMLCITVSAEEPEEMEVICTDHGVETIYFEADTILTDHTHTVEEVTNYSGETRGSVSSVIRDTFIKEVRDDGGTLKVRLKIVVTGVFLSDLLYGEIDSISYEFLYRSNSDYTCTTAINGNTASVRLNLQDFRLDTFTFRITDSGNIIEV